MRRAASAPRIRTAPRVTRRYSAGNGQEKSKWQSVLPNATRMAFAKADCHDRNQNANLCYRMPPFGSLLTSNAIDESLMEGMPRLWHS